MSRDVASVVLALRQINSFQVASFAALVYDYLLLFGNEVDLIWAWKRSFVTLLYAIMRYLGFFIVIVNLCFYGNMPWTPSMWATLLSLKHATTDDVGPPSGLVWYELLMWAPYAFRLAMDVIMMKRVYALSCGMNCFLNSPKLVVGIMATAFIAKHASTLTLLFLDIGPGSHIIPKESGFRGTHVCGTVIRRSKCVLDGQFPTLAFEALLFVLAFGYFVSDVWVSWRSEAPGACKVNNFVKILTRDSTIYFAINVAATTLAVANPPASESMYRAVSFALQQFLPICFSPRLVLNVREQERRMHMSQPSRELSEMQFAESMSPHVENTDGVALGVVD